MKIAIICGSQRQNSQTRKVGGTLQQLLETRGVASYLLDLATLELPHFDDSFWKQPDGALQQQWQPIGDQLSECEALIVIAPDWHGMAPSVLKNFFLYCGTSEVANKPGLLIGVSVSSGGHLPVTELRISSAKNNRICWIPDHLIVRNVKQCLNSAEASEFKDDLYIHARVKHSLDLLTEYANALQLVRDSGVADYKTYPYGM
ncbi:NAD(P)H-dependent oxidoreductase [Halioxenophilus aromaticivorans]